MNTALRPILCLSASGLLLTNAVFAQGPLAPPGPPAPTLKTLDQLDTAIAQTNTKIDALAAQGKVEKFTTTGSVFVGNGVAACGAVAVPPGRLVKLESIVAYTFGSSNTTASFGFNVRLDADSEQTMRIRLPLASLTADNTTTRTGTVEIPLWVRGGTVANAEVGEAYGLVVCVDTAVGESVQGHFYMSGVYE